MLAFDGFWRFTALRFRLPYKDWKGHQQEPLGGAEQRRPEHPLVPSDDGQLHRLHDNKRLVQVYDYVDNTFRCCLGGQAGLERPLSGRNPSIETC
jgi:hypothetical protein